MRPTSIAGIAAILLAAASAEAATQNLTLPTAGTAFAISNAGTVAVWSDDGSLRLFDNLSAGNVTPTATHNLDPQPAALVWKTVGATGYFLAVSEGGHTITVLNDKTLDVVRQIDIQSPASGVAAARNPADHFAYVATSDRTPGVAIMGTTIRRINLDTFAVDGTCTTSDSMDSGVNRLTASADGAFLYGSRTGTSPSGIFVFQVSAPGAAFKVDRLAYLHEDSPGYVPDPTGQYVGSGNQLMSADWQTAHALDAPIQAFFTDRPLIVGMTQTDIRFYSANSLNRVGSLPINFSERPPESPRAGAPPVARGGAPVPTPPRGRGFPRPPTDRTRLLADSAHRAVYVFAANRCLVLPLADVSLPTEPFLAANVRGPHTLTLGVPATLRLEKLDPRSSITLDNGPRGAAIAGETLTWTPGSGDVGRMTLAFKISDGAVSHIQEVPVQVARPYVALGFTASELAVSADGKIAAALNGANQIDLIRARGAGNAVPPACSIALVDLDKLAVRVQRTLDVPAHALAMDSNFVYVAATESPVFYVLSLKDLTEVKKIFVKSPIQQINPCGTRLFVDANAYALPSLTPLAQDTTDPRFMPQRNLIVTDAGILQRGAFYDRTTGKIRLLTGADSGFLWVNNPVNNMNGSEVPNAAQPWGISLQEFSRRHRDDMGGRFFGNNARVILPDVPAYASLAALPPNAARGGGGGPRLGDPETLQISVSDLVLGQTVARLTLGSVSRNGYSNGIDGGISLRAAPGRLLAAVGDRLYVLPTSEIPVDKLPIPVHFEPAQSQFILDATRVNRLTYKAQGGKGALRFALRTQAEWMDIDATSGTVSIDGPRLLNKALETALNQVRQRGVFQSMPGQPAGQTTAQRVAASIAPSLEQVKDLTGEAITGIPVAVNITVTVADTEQQSAALSHIVLIPVPIDAVARVIDDEQARANQARPGPGPGMPIPPVQPAGDMTALQKQIQTLEQRVHDLEVENRMLKELIQNRAGATTRP